MEYLEMNVLGLEPYEVPGIEGYLTLRVPHADGVFQIDIRKMPEPACHALLPEEARAATGDEAAAVIGKMFKAMMAPDGEVHLPTEEKVRATAVKIAQEFVEKCACRSGKSQASH